MERAVRKVKPEWIFHLAAHGAYSWETDLDRILATNLLGTVNLVRAGAAVGLRGVRERGLVVRVRLQDRAHRARTRWVEPNSHYAVAKVGGDALLPPDGRARAGEDRDAPPLFGLRPVGGSRPPHADDDRARPGRHAAALGRPARGARLRLRRRRERGLRARGGAAASGAGPRVQRGHRHADDDPARGRRCAPRARDRERPRWGTMPNRQWDTSVWVSDSRAIRRALGWKPRYDFERGFRQMVAWMRAEPDRAARYRATQVS